MAVITARQDRAPMDIERTIDIAGPQEQVWAVMADVERWPEWTASVTGIERLDAGPLDVGSQARIRQPRLPTLVWTVTAVQTGRYFEWQNVRPGLTTVASHRVEGLAGNGTYVTLSFGWRGFLAPLIRLVYGKLSRRYVEVEAQSLKATLRGKYLPLLVDDDAVLDSFHTIQILPGGDGKHSAGEPFQLNKRGVGCRIGTHSSYPPTCPSL
jgi:uncharacterized membrane protein